MSQVTTTSTPPAVNGEPAEGTPAVPAEVPNTQPEPNANPKLPDAEGGQAPNQEGDALSTLEFNESQTEYVKSLQEQQAQSAEQLKNKELMIQRQGTQIGELRKVESNLNNIEQQLLTLKQSNGVLKENIYDDPTKYEQNVQQIAQLEAQKSLETQQLQKHQIIQAVPEYEKLKTTVMPEILKQEGAYDYEIPGLLQQLDKNPAVAIQLAKRAKETNKLKELEEQIKKTKTSASNIATKIAAAQTQTPITRSNSQGADTPNPQAIRTGGVGMFSSV